MGDAHARTLAILIVASRLTLREGIAPVRDRLLTTLFLAGLLHAIVILGVTFNAAADAGAGAPGLKCCSSRTSCRKRAQRLRDLSRPAHAAGLRQHHGIGRAAQSAPRPCPIPGQEGLPDGNAHRTRRQTQPAARERARADHHGVERQVRYLADAGDAGPTARTARC